MIMKTTKEIVNESLQNKNIQIGINNPDVKWVLMVELEYDEFSVSDKAELNWTHWIEANYHSKRKR